MLSYLKTEKLADNTLTLVAICVASAIGIFATYNWGKATDKVGRRPIYLFGTLVMVIFAFPMFLLVNTGIAVLIVIAVVIAYAVIQNSLAGAQGSWFPELFNANTRSSGASMAYQFSAVVSGFTPFVVTLLYAAWAGSARPTVLPLRPHRPDRHPGHQGNLRAASSARRSRHWKTLCPGRLRPNPPCTATPIPPGADMTTIEPRESLLTAPTEDRIEGIRQAAHRIRLNALNMGEVQGQGYIGQALGVADVLAVIYTHQLRHRPEDPHWPDRDRFLLSIGHYAIALYAALIEAGTIPVEELATYGCDDSRLPMSGMASYTPGMEISGGSLGHGLAIATGMALGLRHRATLPASTTCSPTVSSTKAPRGRPRCRRPTTAWTTSPPSSTSTNCKPTAPRPGCCAPSR